MIGRLIREKRLIDKELKLYRQEKTLEIDRKLVDLQTSVAVDTANEEHAYHSKQEELGINIAKLEAQAEMMENDVNTYKTLIKEKDKELERMNKIVLEMSKNQGAVNVVK